MRAILRILAILYTLSIAFIVYYKYHFWYDSKVIFFHLMVVSSGLLVLFLLSMAISTLRTRWIRAMLTAVISLTGSIYLISLLLSYILIIGGKSQGAGVLPVTVLYSHLKSFNAILQVGSISKTAGYSAIALILAGLAGLAYYLNKIIPPAIAEFKEYSKAFAKEYARNDEKSKRRDKILAVVALLACLVLQLRASFVTRMQDAREPLVAMILGESRFMGMFHLADYKEPPSVRNDYPHHISFDKKNVILIIVDALRADQMGVYGCLRNTTPYLQQLYDTKKLQRIDYAFSTSAASFPGILSILRSKPGYNLAYHNFSLQDVLKDQGYGVHFILSGDHDNWYDMKYFYGSSVGNYFDGRQSAKYVCDDDLLSEGLSKIAPYSDTPAFFYFHMMSAHYAGLKHPEYLRWTPANLKPEPSSYTNNYDNGVLQSDHYIHQLMDQLDHMGYMRNSIVVITADHGESLGERETYGHVNNVYNEEIHIPLLIYDTDTSIRYDRRDFATQPDISATIIDRLGLPVPATWEGKSLLRNGYNTQTYHSVGDDYAIISYRDHAIYKYVINTSGNTEELYELRSDIAERKNMIRTADPEYVKQLRADMKTYLAEHRNY